VIAEFLMHVAGFDAIWYAHPGKYSFFSDGRWHAGHWSGPDGDLVCVRMCATKEVAEKSLSPGSHTVVGALLKALVVRRHPEVGRILWR